MVLNITVKKNELELMFNIWRGIYVGKSREKKFLEKKNLEIKKSEFSQILGKNVTGNKVLWFGFLGLFS